MAAKIIPLPGLDERHRVDAAVGTARRVLDGYAEGRVSLAVATWTLIRSASEVEPIALTASWLDLPPTPAA